MKVAVKTNRAIVMGPIRQIRGFRPTKFPRDAMTPGYLLVTEKTKRSLKVLHVILVPISSHLYGVGPSHP